MVFVSPLGLLVVVVIQLQLSLAALCHVAVKKYGLPCRVDMVLMRASGARGISRTILVREVGFNSPPHLPCSLLMEEETSAEGTFRRRSPAAAGLLVSLRRRPLASDTSTMEPFAG